MKSRVTTIAIALAAMGAATSVSAADLGRGSVKDRVPYYPPAAYTGPFTWTGFYLGLQTGYVWGDASHSFSDGSFGGSSDPNGWVGGGYAGYNWQSGNFVFGLEGDIEGGDVGGSFHNAAGRYRDQPIWIGKAPCALECESRQIRRCSISPAAGPSPRPT